MMGPSLLSSHPCWHYCLTSLTQGVDNVRKILPSPLSMLSIQYVVLWHLYSHDALLLLTSTLWVPWLLSNWPLGGWSPALNTGLFLHHPFFFQWAPRALSLKWGISQKKKKKWGISPTHCTLIEEYGQMFQKSKRYSGEINLAICIFSFLHGSGKSFCPLRDYLVYTVVFKVIASLLHWLNLLTSS